jgi:hypothetical protein
MIKDNKIKMMSVLSNLYISKSTTMDNIMMLNKSDVWSEEARQNAFKAINNIDEMINELEVEFKKGSKMNNDRNN